MSSSILLVSCDEEAGGGGDSVIEDTMSLLLAEFDEGKYEVKSEDKLAVVDESNEENNDDLNADDVSLSVVRDDGETSEDSPNDEELLKRLVANVNPVAVPDKEISRLDCSDEVAV